MDEVRPGFPQQRSAGLRLRHALHHTHRHHRQQRLSPGVLLTAHAQDVGQHLSGKSGDIRHVRAAVLCPGGVAASWDGALARRTICQPTSPASR